MATTISVAFVTAVVVTGVHTPEAGSSVLSSVNPVAEAGQAIRRLSSGLVMLSVGPVTITSGEIVTVAFT